MLWKEQGAPPATSLPAPSSPPALGPRGPGVNPLLPRSAAACMGWVAETPCPSPGWASAECRVPVPSPGAQPGTTRAGLPQQYYPAPDHEHRDWGWQPKVLASVTVPCRQDAAQQDGGQERSSMGPPPCSAGRPWEATRRAGREETHRFAASLERRGDTSVLGWLACCASYLGQLFPGPAFNGFPLHSSAVGVAGRASGRSVPTSQSAPA